jgi:hypothetical protein
VTGAAGRHSGTVLRHVLEAAARSPPFQHHVRSATDQEKRKKMPVAYVDIPTAVNDGAKKKIFQELYEEFTRPGRFLTRLS